MKSSTRMQSLALMAALVGVAGLEYPSSQPTKAELDRKRRAPDDIQSRMDKNAAKRARRAARNRK